MYLSKIITCSVLLISSGFCFAALKAISPASLAEMEKYEISKLEIQNGCARPDLSDSAVDGKAIVEISFAPDGKPLDAQIISSNGSDSDNAKIIEAFTKRCKYVSEPVSIPVGATKQFTYNWKAHQALSGLGTCMLKIEYPAASVRLQEEGKAIVSYRYRTDGSYESKISQSTGFPRLDDTTLKKFNACLDNHALKADPDINKWNEVSMNWKITGNDNSRSSAQQSSPPTAAQN